MMITRFAVMIPSATSWMASVPRATPGQWALKHFNPSQSTQERIPPSVISCPFTSGVENRGAQIENQARYQTTRTQFSGDEAERLGSRAV